MRHKVAPQQPGRLQEALAGELARHIEEMVEAGLGDGRVKRADGGSSARGGEHLPQCGSSARSEHAAQVLELPCLRPGGVEVPDQRLWLELVSLVEQLSSLRQAVSRSED